MNIKGYFKKFQNKSNNKKSKLDNKKDAPKEGLKASILAMFNKKLRDSTTPHSRLWLHSTKMAYSHPHTSPSPL